MYMTWGVARRRWLWIAVIWMPCSISFFITGFTSSCKSTRSPITIASLPLFWNARYEPSASGGLIWTPSTVTVRSLRPMPTRYTPPGISVPDRPIAFATPSQSLSAASTDIDELAAIIVLATLSPTYFMAYPLMRGYTIRPATAASATMAGAGIFFAFQRSSSVTAMMAMVGISVIERLPSTTTAPAMVPIAAAVQPSTKATMAGFLPCLRKYGAGIMVKR